jgi:periplasmic divalent cation tolerance protein
MTGSDRFLAVFVTVPDVEQGERIAAALVEERLAACVNVLPGCRSVYRWEGRVQRDDEALMMVKTSREGFAALERRVSELHPYDVPEIIAVDLTAVSAPYRDFLRDSLSS